MSRKRQKSKTKKNDDSKDQLKWILIPIIATAIVGILVKLPENIVQRFYDLRLKGTHVFLETQFDAYSQGYIGNEAVPVFVGNRDTRTEYAPTVKCTLLRK